MGFFKHAFHKIGHGIKSAAHSIGHGVKKITSPIYHKVVKPIGQKVVMPAAKAVKSRVDKANNVVNHLSNDVLKASDGLAGALSSPIMWVVAAGIGAAILVR